jgi:hypothetical protein
MRAYSAERAPTLENIRPRHICNLLAIVQDATLSSRSFIASRFAESATHFDETLAFLENIGWLRSVEGQLQPTSKAIAHVVAADERQRNVVLAEALFGDAGPYERVFARYLREFRLRDRELVYQPSADARLRDASVRDFLMDLGAVTHHVAEDLYVLEQPFAAWALWARNVLGLSTAQLRQNVEDRSAFGRDAELAVLTWERQRVGEQWEGRVRHISDGNPTACFDIQSVTVVGVQAEPRFIEVKAVAADSFEFHWSGAEIEAAEILASSYFLYLLPVSAGGAFDVRRMEIIPNAYAEVYRNPSKWLATVTDIVCRRKESLDS